MSAVKQQQQHQQQQQQQWPVGTQIRKYFENLNQWYVGHVDSFDPPSGLYSIHYEHDDQEEYSWSP